MSILLRVSKPSTAQPTDHNSLSNIGTKTHDELDIIASEVENARGTKPSLLERLSEIVASIITKHSDLQEAGTTPHADLDDMYSDYTTAKGSYTTLDERLDNLTPVMNLSSLQDVNVTGINDGQTIIWNSTESKFKPGTATGGSGGGGLTEAQINTLIQNALIPVQSKYDSEIESLERKNIRIQFKYDIALNLVKNYCSDYFIDVLQDSSNIEEFDGVAFDSVNEVIQ